MRYLLLSGVALLVSALPATAQISGLSGGGLGGGGLGGGGLGGGLGGSGGLGGTGSFIGGGGGLGGSSGGTFLGATSGTGNTSNRSGANGRQAVGTTTFLGPYFGNPLSLGIASSNGSLPTSPTFGTTLYNVTGTGGGGNSGSSYGGLAGANGSLGGTATTGTIGALSFGVRRAPAYTTTLGFQPRVESSNHAQTNLQQYLSRSERLPSRGDIRVDVDGPTVVLRGVVADEHERRLAEALARLTPGVHDLRNELSVRASAAAAGP